MHMTKQFIVATIFITMNAACIAKADDTSTATSSADLEKESVHLPVYRPQELDVDLFGSTSLGQETLEHFSGDHFRHHVLYGGGGGLTFFFLKYFGVGGEYEADARASRFVDSASGNVYVRLPIEQIHLSPYVFGGGGYQFEDLRQRFAQAGAGLEYRFCSHLGIFVDGRYIFANKTENYALARAGFRISF